MFVSVSATAKLLRNKEREQEEDIKHDGGKSW